MCSATPLSPAGALSPLSELEERFILFFIISHYTFSISYCQDYSDQLSRANIYCFRAELSAEGAKRGVETPPEVFPPDDLPRPSRPKAGLGLVMIMMISMIMMLIKGEDVYVHDDHDDKEDFIFLPPKP